MRAESLVILNGISGSGRSTALKAFDDLGYFCVDNLPAPLIPDFVNFLLDLPQKWARTSDVTIASGGTSESLTQKFALLVSCRDEDAFPNVQLALEKLTSQGISVSLLYFDAQDEVVIRRFSETRRPHPLVGTSVGVTNITEALARERWLLADFRAAAHRIIDTTQFSPHDLRRAVESYLGQQTKLEIVVKSFGFKYGVPSDVDLLMDVRFLPNPHFVAELQALTGADEQVKDYVFQSADAEQFLGHYLALLGFLLPRYQQEGKRYLTIAIGCTGGKHRSVAIARELQQRLSKQGHNVSIAHRDMQRIG